MTGSWRGRAGRRRIGASRARACRTRRPRGHEAGAATSHRCAETGTAVGGTTATAFPAPTLLTERGARLPRGSSPEDEDTLGWGRGHRRPTGEVPRAPQEGKCLGKPGQARVEHFEAKTNNTFPYKAANSRTKRNPDARALPAPPPRPPHALPLGTVDELRVSGPGCQPPLPPGPRRLRE